MLPEDKLSSTELKIRKGKDRQECWSRDTDVPFQGVGLMSCVGVHFRRTLVSKSFIKFLAENKLFRHSWSSSSTSTWPTTTTKTTTTTTATATWPTTASTSTTTTTTTWPKQQQQQKHDRNNNNNNMPTGYRSNIVKELCSKKVEGSSWKHFELLMTSPVFFSNLGWTKSNSDQSKRAIASGAMAKPVKAALSNRLGKLYFT